MVKTARLAAVALALAASASTLAVAGATPTAGPPAGLSASGRALWNFEALLRQTFGPTYKGCLRSLSRYVESFTKDSFCAQPGSMVTE